MWNCLIDEMNKDYFKDLMSFVDEEYKTKLCYPEKKYIFRAFDLDYKDVKCVILGQDPYINGEAMGLSFSVPQNIKTPPTLINIFKELKDDLKIERTNSDLSDWAKQGVLLLNSILTVEAGISLSHKNKGWEKFTDYVLERLNELEGIVFILWGNDARKKKKLLTNPKNLIIESSHPSPLGCYRTFYGSKPFSRCNEFLELNNKGGIKW